MVETSEGEDLRYIDVNSSSERARPHRSRPAVDRHICPFISGKRPMISFTLRRTSLGLGSSDLDRQGAGSPYSVMAPPRGLTAPWRQGTDGEDRSMTVGSVGKGRD